MEQLPLDEAGDIPMRALAHQNRWARGWDLLVLEALVPTQPTHLALVGLRGRLRLLAGMVWDNRPWRLVSHLV